MSATTPVPEVQPTTEPTTEAAGQTTAVDARPASYSLVVPPEWWRIDLEPERRTASIEALTRRQFRGVDDLPHLRRMLAEEIGRQAEDAFANGGIEMYLSMITAGPVPVSSSLVVSLVPVAGGELSRDDLHTLARDLGQASTPGVRYDVSEVVDLGVGPAIRRTTYTEGSGMSTPENPVSDSCGVDWFVPVPRGAGALMLLSFSSPLVMIRDDITGLFDAVVSTFSWRG